MTHVRAHVGRRRESREVCLVARAGIENVGCIRVKIRKAMRMGGVEQELRCLRRGRMLDQCRELNEELGGCERRKDINEKLAGTVNESRQTGSPVSLLEV
jgi:hypothetical protein